MVVSDSFPWYGICIKFDPSELPGTLNNHFLKGCLVKQSFFNVMIGNHPIETTKKTWLIGVPGGSHFMTPEIWVIYLEWSEEKLPNSWVLLPENEDFEPANTRFRWKRRNIDPNYQFLGATCLVFRGCKCFPIFFAKCGVKA